eukprot:EG_transcript_23995
MSRTQRRRSLLASLRAALLQAALARLVDPPEEAPAESPAAPALTQLGHSGTNPCQPAPDFDFDYDYQFDYGYGGDSDEADGPEGGSGGGVAPGAGEAGEDEEDEEEEEEDGEYQEAEEEEEEEEEGEEEDSTLMPLAETVEEEDPTEAAPEPAGATATCALCRADTAIPAEPITARCAHPRALCANCVRWHIRRAVVQGGSPASHIPCPLAASGECSADLEDDDVRRQADPEDFEAYLKPRGNPDI